METPKKLKTYCENCQWMEVIKKMPPPCIDILFTDRKEIFKGWLETYEEGEEPVFYNSQEQTRRSQIWPEDITHWMHLPSLPE